MNLTEKQLGGWSQTSHKAIGVSTVNSQRNQHGKLSQFRTLRPTNLIIQRIHRIINSPPYPPINS